MEVVGLWLDQNWAVHASSLAAKKREEH
jgi:hypothetical protein